EVKELLNQYIVHYGLEMDIINISNKIYFRTNGYKGLVGACFRAIETEVMPGECELSSDGWVEYSSTRLIKFIKGSGAFKSITRAINGLSQNKTDLIGNILHYSSYTCHELDDDELDFLLAEGLIRSKDVNEVHKELECSSLILRSTILSMISGPEFEAINPPLSTDEVDTQWLIENIIEHIAVQHVFAQQALNNNNSPSEYAFQAEFTSILKYLLSTVYPDLQYRVIVEARDKDANENSLKRIDILISANNQPAYGFELTVEANQRKFDEHVVRTVCYRDIHKCRIFVINICTNDKLVDYFGQKHEDVVPLHVLYNIDKGTADIIYEDRKKLVHIKRSSWQIMLN
ncbi:18664_t:CDS:2, partial [Dentiscutata erythropus]